LPERTGDIPQLQLDRRRVLAICSHTRFRIVNLHASSYGRLRSTIQGSSAEVSVNQLIAFLLDHAMLDFSGDLSLDMVKDFLRGDDSPEARALLAKLVQERGVDDMIVTLADCLQESLRSGLTEDVVRDQLRLYSES
jgi:hypothetical protein